METVVRHRDIIGIFNIETATVSSNSRRFLADAEKGGRVVNVCEQKLPAAFVVCEDQRYGERVFIAQISAATLKKRAEEL